MTVSGNEKAEILKDLLRLLSPKLLLVLPVQCLNAAYAVCCLSTGDWEWTKVKALFLEGQAPRHSRSVQFSSQSTRLTVTRAPDSDGDLSAGADKLLTGSECSWSGASIMHLTDAPGSDALVTVAGRSGRGRAGPVRCGRGWTEGRRM